MTKKVNNFLSENLILSIIPIVGYAINYSYELGYANYFHITSDLINLSIESIIYSIILTFITVFGFINILDIFVREGGSVFMKIDKRLIRILIPNIVLILVCLFLFVMVGYHPYLIIVTVVFIALLLMDIIFGFIGKGKKSFAEAMINNYDKDAQKYGLYTYIKEKMGENLFRLTIFIFLGLVITYSIGYNKARQKDYFYVSTTNPNKVLLKIYKDTMVIGKLSADKRKLDPIYEISKLGKGDSIEWKIVKLGTLGVN